MVLRGTSDDWHNSSARLVTILFNARIDRDPQCKLCLRLLERGIRRRGKWAALSNRSPSIGSVQKAVLTPVATLRAGPLSSEVSLPFPQAVWVAVADGY